MPTAPIDILVAEDNEDDILLIQEAFGAGQLANRLAIVRDGEEVFAYLRQEGAYRGFALPNMVLLDINMPKKTGLEVLQELKADAKLRALPVVMMTVSERDEDILRSFEQGACSYIRKPVTLARFVEVFRDFEQYWSLVSRVPPLKR